MTLTREKRIALELLGPPVLGGSMAAAWAVVDLARNANVAVTNALVAGPALLLLYLAFAIPMIGIQAGGYALVMEWRFARGLDPRGWRMVGLSTALGFASGAVVALAYGMDRKDTWYLFNSIGPTVGFVLGLLIKHWSPEEKTAAELDSRN
jgi:hypothetical protein